MNEVLRNIGRALDSFFSELSTSTPGKRRPVSFVDHGDPDAGRAYITSLSATTSTFNLAQRTLDNYDVLTDIAPAEFWLAIEEDALS